MANVDEYSNEPRLAFSGVRDTCPKRVTVPYLPDQGIFWRHVDAALGEKPLNTQTHPLLQHAGYKELFEREDL